MAEAPRAASPPLDIDGIVVDLHTNISAAATAAQALFNENSNASNASFNENSNAGINLKFPILFTSSSDSESEPFNVVQRNPLRVGAGDDAATTTSGAARPASPPPNCAICLGRCKNKCFTNSCVHQFCFKCLAEWSKVKAECPLCKQPFRSIIHNVKSIDQFEEYLVQTPTVQLPHSPLEVRYQGPLRGFSVNGSRGFYNFSMRSYRNAIPSRAGPITIRNFDFGADGPIPSASVAVNAAVETMPMRDPEFFRRQMPDEYGNDLPVGQLWRRYIYDRKLYALPVSDITGRFRECSARYYRANPGQIIRLIPFANRDLVCLLRNTNHNVTRVLETLHSGLEVSNILSRSFRRRLQPFLGERTAHFIHELSNFARSPYDMIGYDDYVQYAPQSVGEEQIIEFSSSGDEETNNNNNANNNNNNNVNTVDENPTSTSNDARSISRRSARRAQAASGTNTSSSSGFPPMSLLSFTITTTTEGSEAPGVSVAVSAGSRGGHAQVAAINLSTHNRAHNEVVIDLDDTVEVNGGNGSGNGGDSVEVANGGTIATGANNTAAETTSTVPQGSPQVVASIALSTSSSDECEFVLERKPPHLRTPEMVSLNSESDSDVVFVEESKPILAEATYSTSDEGTKKAPTMATLMDEQEKQREREKRTDDTQYNEPEASTSTGLRSRTLRQIVAAKRSHISPTTSDVPAKRRRARFQRATKAAQTYNSDDSTTTDDDTDDSNFSSRNRSQRGRRAISSSSSKRRGSSNARKRVALPGRKSRKRSRASNIKTETTKLQQTTERPRRSRNSSKSAAQISNYSTENDSSTEEDDKVNLKALQQRLKTSLSDIEANMAEQAMQEDSNNYSLANSPQIPANFSTSAAQNNEYAANSNSDADSAPLKRQLNLATNFSLCDNFDERPSTSAAAAAAAAAMKSAPAYEESDNSDVNNETKNVSPLRLSPPNSPAQSTSDNNLRLRCSSPLSSSSHSSMSSFQLPSTSQQHENKQQQKHVGEFTARFNYSSSSDSTTNSSSSSLTQSSASATSASEDELN